MPQTNNSTVSVSLLMTGSELMSGEIVDSNSAFIAKELSSIGLRILQKLTVDDDLNSIRQAIRHLASSSDIVIVNGGLGATVDDKTSEAASHVSHRKLVLNQDALRNLEKRYGKTILDENSDYSAQIKKQALLPEGVGILPNSVGIAVGFTLKIDSALFFFTPGVPSELKTMVTEAIIPELKRRFPSLPKLRKRVIQVVGIGESQVQKLINQAIPESVWKELQLGFRAASSSVEIKLFGTGNASEALLSKTEKTIRHLLTEFHVNTGESPSDVVVRQLKERSKTLVVAESCTGGLLASRLTSVAGVSEVFKAGIVTYSNRSKTELLGVPADVIEEWGAVSEQVALAMVRGALGLGFSDYAIAITGIAGPTGGTPQKPVGTVFISWGERDDLHVRRLLIRHPRNRFQRLATLAALDIFRRYTRDLPTDVFYYFDELSLMSGQP